VKAVMEALNWLSDLDWGWWPLLRLRPEKSEQMTSRLVLRLTPLFGTLAGLAIAAIAQHLASITHLLLDIAIGWIAFFVIQRGVFAPAWNARARKLAGDDA
jgi:hypothetical protein